MEDTITTVVIVDDHALFREGVRALLEREAGFEVVGEASNGREASKLVAKQQPHLVLMDIGMSGLNGIDATRAVLAANPRTKVVAISMHSDRHFISGMLQAGALGYLLKECAFEELHTAIEVVLKGKIYLSPQIAGTLVEDYVEALGCSGSPHTVSLTNQERSVLQLIAEGKSTKDTASVLHVSVKTIETHRKRIMDKLGLHSVAELTKFAIKEGITSL